MAELRVLTATAPCTGLRAVAEACGEPVGQRELARRVGHLTALIQSMAACVVTAHWNGEDLDRLASGRSADGRTLPSKGWMALRRLGWAAAAPDGVVVDRVSEQAALLRVQLPLTAAPAGRKDWAWHAMAFTLPPTVAAEAVLCAPTLRLAAHRVCLDLPHRALVPKTSPAGHTVGLGLDWGVNTLLAGALAHLATTPTGTRTVSDGRMLRYDATAISAKLHRLRQVRERVAARLNAYAALLDGLAAPDAPATRADEWVAGRAKSGPTPKRPPAAVRKTSRRVPDRRAVPAPPSGGQCPAGQEPQSRPRPGTASGPACGLLNPRHDRTGFHRVRASPVLALGDFGAGEDRPRQARNA